MSKNYWLQKLSIMRFEYKVYVTSIPVGFGTCLRGRHLPLIIDSFKWQNSGRDSKNILWLVPCTHNTLKTHFRHAEAPWLFQSNASYFMYKVIAFCCVAVSYHIVIRTLWNIISRTSKTRGNISLRLLLRRYEPRKDDH